MKKESFNSVKYRNSYNRDHYDIMRLSFPAGTKEQMLQRAEEIGCVVKGKPSISSYLYHLFMEDIRERMDGCGRHR